MNKIKLLENDLEYYKKENTNKIEVIKNKDNLLYKKEEELRRLILANEKLNNRQAPQIDIRLLEEKENTIKSLRQHIEQRDKIIQSFKDRQTNPSESLINSLKMELKKKDKIISQLCGKDINNSNY